MIETAQVDTSAEFNFSATANAIAKIAELIGEEQNNKINLRIFVQGGGCSGLRIFPNVLRSSDLLNSGTSGVCTGRPLRGCTGGDNRVVGLFRYRTSRRRLRVQSAASWVCWAEYRLR